MSKTTVVNMRHDEYDVRIDRRSKWGNPFKMLDKSDAERERVIAEYARYIREERHDLLDAIEELRGKRLGCWCKPQACHGDVLLQLLIDLGPEDELLASLESKEGA